jgi:hypothetical protein
MKLCSYTDDLRVNITINLMETLERQGHQARTTSGRTCQDIWGKRRKEACQKHKGQHPELHDRTISSRKKRLESRE